VIQEGTWTGLGLPRGRLRCVHAVRLSRVPSGYRYCLLVLIKAWLQGHDFDLMTLAELFREGDPAVIANDEGYSLDLPAPDGLLDDGARLYEAASVLLRRVNGVARTRSSDFRPVGLIGRFSDETGRRHSVVLAEAAEARASALAAVVAVDGQQPPTAPAPGPGYVQLAQTHSDVAEVLEILGRPDSPPDWVDLYKVFEIVLDNTPGLYKRGWVTKAELDAFTASATRPDVSGALARHARVKGKPPKRTMTLIEARQTIGVLVTAWLDSLRP
jgi:hypothetical protein